MSGKDMVKILCASDLHGCVEYRNIANMAIRRKVDVVAFAGDIETSIRFASHEDHFKTEFLGAVKKMLSHGIEVVATPGNHDYFLKSEMDSGRNRFAGNLHILVDRCETVCGLRFYGTPWVPFINGRWCWEMDDEELSEKFRAIPSGIDVLVSHTPPNGTSEKERWDVPMLYDRRFWRHLGSRSLRDAVQRCRPRCVVCGHIHSGDHGLNRIGDTAVVNCSILDERYSEAYKPAEIMVETGGGSAEMKFRTGEDMKWKTINQIGGTNDV